MTTIPDIAIIVPYRDRERHRLAFIKIMPYILENINYKVFFIHQRDERPFNRGAIKNLGFKYLKLTYPKHYKTMTIVFNDIDNLPANQGQFSYNTVANTIKHFYGYEQTLGGIFAIKGEDFEKLNGFANIWTWGLEDNILMKRALKNKINIDRSEKVGITEDNKNIISLWHGWERFISPNIQSKFTNDDGVDGIGTLYNIKMENAVQIEGEFYEVNITGFETGESLQSPYVKDAKMMHALEYKRLDQPAIFNLEDVAILRHERKTKQRAEEMMAEKRAQVLNQQMRIKQYIKQNNRQNLFGRQMNRQQMNRQQMNRQQMNRQQMNRPQRVTTNIGNVVRRRTSGFLRMR